MGYLVPYGATKADIVKEVTKGAHKFAVRGNIVYALHTDSETGIKFIAVIKLQKYDGSYGYKTMDERMYPYYFDCPESLLKLSEDNSEMAQTWRQACRNHARDKKENNALYNDLVIGKENHFIHNERLVKFMNTYSKQYVVGKDVESQFMYRYKIRNIKRVDKATKVA